MNIHPLNGQEIIAVFLSKKKEEIRFDVKGGGSVFASTYGDCCSYTWIEQVDGAEQLIGKVVSVEDVPMPNDIKGKDMYDVIEQYGLKITTDKGYGLIEYRNSSNGYYGGNLEFSNRLRYEFDEKEWEKIA
jgi:hypothetical protein